VTNTTDDTAGKIPLMFITNDRTPFKANMLMMIYKAVGMGQVGYMDGLHPETGEIHPLLVGIEPTEDGQFRVHALAKIFNKLDEIPQYLMPDGNGNYIDYRPKLSPIPEGCVEANPVEARQEDRKAKKGRPRKKRDGGTLGRPDGENVSRGTGGHGDLSGVETNSTPV
jgi:hypothetical protein